MREPQTLIGQSIIARSAEVFAELEQLDEPEKVAVLNELRAQLHKHSPFAEEPVDLVQWVPVEDIEGNSYNPNVVAPPELRLLAISIAEDGYTQPIVAFPEDGSWEIVDGFHRHLIGKRNHAIRERVHGYLPITEIRPKRTGQADRMASTIRHNRARGEHSIPLMQHLVAELVEVGMGDQWIMTHLGMDTDELLRLKQLTGLAALFLLNAFSRARELGLAEGDAGDTGDTVDDAGQAARAEE